MTKREPDGPATRQPVAVPASATRNYFANKSWLLALALMLVTFVAYTPVRHAGFIWDDDDHLTANPAMTAPHGLQMIWSSLAVSRYYPLTLTSLWIQRRFWGLNPLPYHLVNVALHATNGLLLYFVLRRLRIATAWVAAMLWVLHPVNVESVAWVTELKNTQSGVFFFLALLCFLRFEAQEARRWYALAVLCGLAALLSKPSTVVLPLVLLLCAWWERGRWQRADMVRLAPFFGLALGMSALTVIEQRGIILREGTPEWKLGMAERLVIAGKAVWFYASKLVWPAQLTFVYPRWELDTRSVSSWMPLAGLVAAGILLWVRRRESWAQASLFGCGVFVAALLPVLGFFDVYYFRYAYVADHFQYLAGVALIVLVATAGAKLCARTGQPGKIVAIAGVPILILALGTLTWTQAGVYRDPESVWHDTLAKNPACWMAHNNLGHVLVAQGRLQEAIQHYEQALRINPDHAEVHYNLGVALEDQGKLPEAITHYEQALQINPDYADAHYNLGTALMLAGRVQEAIGHYEQAVRIQPDYAEAHCNLGVALQQAGQVPEAIAHFEQALRIQPDIAEAHNNLAVALAQVGRMQEAVEHWQEALRINPDLADARDNLARARAVQ